MAKTILTAKQLDFLELIQREPQITKRFYLTGGTALAEFYLKHRLSEDLDLFTEKEEVNQKLVEIFLKTKTSKIGVKKINKTQFLGLMTYFLIYNDGESLKVDFSYYPFPRIRKGKKYKNLMVDSVYDIAVNKLHTLFMKPRSRDYIDLYFMMKKYDYSLKKLRMDAKSKFDWDIDSLNLANQLIKVKDYDHTESPKLLLPFKVDKMEKFFLRLAKDLKREIFK